MEWLRKLPDTAQERLSTAVEPSSPPAPLWSVYWQGRWRCCFHLMAAWSASRPPSPRHCARCRRHTAAHTEAVFADPGPIPAVVGCPPLESMLLKPFRSAAGHEQPSIPGSSWPESFTEFDHVCATVPVRTCSETVLDHLFPVGAVGGSSDVASLFVTPGKHFRRMADQGADVVVAPKPGGELHSRVARIVETAGDNPGPALSHRRRSSDKLMAPPCSRMPSYLRERTCDRRRQGSCCWRSMGAGTRRS